MELSLIEKAFRFAEEKHRGHTRKGEDVPYLTHLVTVSIRLAQYGFSDVVIAAGLVHDVVEDTLATIEEVREELGEEVAELVATVTYDESLSWEEKRYAYTEAVRNGSEGAKAISIMDKIHNAESTLIAYEEVGSSVWDRFNRGKDTKIHFEEMMLSMFEETWEHPFVKEYQELVQKLKAAN